MADLLTLEEALDRVLAAARPAPRTELVPIGDAAGRVLARDAACDAPWPSADRSAMDGFALLAGERGVQPGTKLPVAGESLAGKPFQGRLSPGTAIRIMTGALVPDGADAVVPVEHTSGYAGSTVEVAQRVARGANIRRLGSELAAGTVVLRSGTCIGPAEAGALAVLGLDPVPVHARLVVAILSTGDEVVPLEKAPATHQVRDSNSYALSAQVVAAGGAPLRLGIAPDDARATRALLEKGLFASNVLLSIGGISEGTHDLVQDQLLALGVQKVFHGIQLKPGKPTFFGIREAGPARQYVFGLPGNPASCFTVFELLVRPLLHVLQTRARAPGPVTAELAGAPWKPNARLQAIPARIAAGADGKLVATLGEQKTSGDPFGLVPANGFVLIPPRAEAKDTPRAEVRFYQAGLAPR